MAKEDDPNLLFWHWAMPQPRAWVEEGFSSDDWFLNELRMGRGHANT